MRMTPRRDGEQTIEDRRDELWLEHGMSWDDAVRQAVEERKTSIDTEEHT